MSANESKQVRWLLGVFISVVIVLVALLTTGMILKYINKDPEIPTPEAQNSSDVNMFSRRPSTRPPTMFDATTKAVKISNSPRNVCETPECIALAHRLHNFQDTSVDPCQDFYKSVCGKYSQHSSESAQSREKGKIVEQLVTEYLDKNLPTSSKSENVMKIYHQKCEESRMNKTQLSEVYAGKLRGMYEMVSKIGKWPLVDKSWKQSDFNLNDMMSNMAKLGKTDFGFFKFFIKTVVFISPDDKQLTASRLKENFGSRAKQFWKDFYYVNGISLKEGTLDDYNDDIDDLFLEIEELYQTNRTTKDSDDIGLSELQKHVPSVDFERIIRNYISPLRKDDIGKNISEKILAEKVDYFLGETENLETLLKTTSHEKLANFLIWNFLASEAYDIMEEEKYMKTISCAQRVINILPLAALRIFVRNHFDKENLDIVSDMTEDFRESFKEMIEESTWLSETTKENALKKLKMMKKTAGYPKEMNVPGALDSFFESLDLSLTDTYYVIQSKVKKFKVEQSLDYIASFLPMESTPDVLTVNAFYRASENSLKITIPRIDAPYFDSSYPVYAKIASLGTVLGHEMGHGFDKHGRKRDENGKKNNWWTAEDSKEYKRRIQCLVDQYDNYDDPDFGKNISCKAKLKHSLKNQLKSVHPTNSFRVNGLFSNMKSFAEAFNCPVGSPMNPEMKCELF